MFPDPKQSFVNEVSEDPLIMQFRKLQFPAESYWDEECDLYDVIRYCRGSKLLVIPPEWRDVLPTSL